MTFIIVKEEVCLKYIITFEIYFQSKMEKQQLSSFAIFIFNVGDFFFKFSKIICQESISYAVVANNTQF